MNKPVLMQGDCLIMMQAIPDNSIDSIVTDPPYGISFIGVELDPDYFNIAQCRINHVL